MGIRAARCRGSPPPIDNHATGHICHCNEDQKWRHVSGPRWGRGPQPMQRGASHGTGSRTMPTSSQAAGAAPGKSPGTSSEARDEGKRAAPRRVGRHHLTTAGRRLRVPWGGMHRSNDKPERPLGPDQAALSSKHRVSQASGRCRRREIANGWDGRIPMSRYHLLRSYGVVDIVGTYMGCFWNGAQLSRPRQTATEPADSRGGM